MLKMITKPLLGLALASGTTPLAAEVIEAGENGFITKDEAIVEADLKATWLALIAPAQWWNSSHTWSGDAKNLILTPQGGGCFCEKIPEVDEPDRYVLEGSVEHMRVIHAFPEKALRMQGALGPLQSEPVTGVLTIVLSEVDIEDGKGTRIVWEYNVGGSMRYEIPVISKAVDGVMSQQLNGLAKMLGRVDKEEAEDASEDAELKQPDPPIVTDPEPEQAESVEDAFSDLEEGEGAL